MSTDMKWAFPTLENPTIVDLNTTGDQTWWQFAPDQDVIFIGADSARTLPKLHTDGGRNIVVLGGEYAPEADGRGAALQFQNVHGAVHVEGVKVDNSKAQLDGIAVGGAEGAQPDVTVQNSVITGIHGTEPGIHADVFQTHGPVGNMRFYNITADTDYQGFFISPQYSPSHLSADFENVNVRYNGGNGFTYQYWFLDGTNQQPYPITLKNVFATERDGQSAEQSSVWPKAGMDDIGAVRVGDQITWPGMPYDGSITVGSPAADFATDASVGLNFDQGAALEGFGMVHVPQMPEIDLLPESGAPTHWIESTDADAVVDGTDGNDQIAGVQGAEDAGLAGGLGDDTYIVDTAADMVVEAADQGVDTVLSYAPAYSLPDNVENLVLGGSLDASATGNDDANRITGNDGANVIDGGLGDDVLTGGAGDDTFVIAKGAGNDTVTDFTTGDTIDLSGFTATAFADLQLAQDGTNTVLTLEDGQTLTLRGVDATNLSEADFTFPVVAQPQPEAPQPEAPQPEGPQVGLDGLGDAIRMAVSEALAKHPLLDGGQMVDFGKALSAMIVDKVQAKMLEHDLFADDAAPAEVAAPVTTTEMVADIHDMPMDHWM